MCPQGRNGGCSSSCLYVEIPGYDERCIGEGRSIQSHSQSNFFRRARTAPTLGPYEHYYGLLPTKLLLVPYKPPMYTWVGVVLGVLWRREGLQKLLFSFPFSIPKSRESFWDDVERNMEVLVKRFIHLDFPCCKIQKHSVPGCHFQAPISHPWLNILESGGAKESYSYTLTCSIASIYSHTKFPSWLFPHLHIVKI